MHGIIQPSDRYIPKLRDHGFDDAPESCDLSVNSSLTTHTPLIVRRLGRQQLTTNNESKDRDKVNFESLSLYGRDDEMEIMKKALDRLSVGEGVVERHLMLISAESGTGKTALALSLATPTAKLNGLFVKGKFDFNNNRNNNPYSGIVRACVEICDHILSLQEQNFTLFQKVSQRIKDGLGSELSLLIKFIPALTGVIDFQDDEDFSTLSVVRSSSEEAKNRFHFAFQRFIRIISDTFAPLILVLDDLQWVDVSSLDLLDICLSDPRIKKVMIVGTFRSNEVDQDHVLIEALSRFRAKCEEGEFEMTSLSIENLDVHNVNKMIQAMLSLGDNAETMDLAKVCFKKTQGNPFFVIQFLYMVRDSGLFKYDFVSRSWEWNCDEINANTSAASNVVDALKEKMTHLPKHVLDILKGAACLGSTFHEMYLRIIWDHLSSLPTSGENTGDGLTTGLKFLEEDGYIVRSCSESSSISSQTFSWTHDKIQEAAMMLIPVEERAAFRHKAGDKLLSSLDEGELQSAIFVVADLLNAGEALVASDEKKLVVARLNHDASLRALSISAFESVADYARYGIKWLPENHWEDHYELSLGLYSVAAQAEGFLGNADEMEQYCNMVLSQKERPLSDKMWVYNTAVNSLVSRAQVEEAADLAFSILGICNCHFPKYSFSIRVGIIRAAFRMKFLRNHLNPRALEKSNDPMMPQLMELMDRLTVALHMKNNPRAVLVNFRVLDWTIKQGYTDYSSVAFACAGKLLTGFLLDFEVGAWYGEHALALAEKCQSSAARARTWLELYAFVFFWTKPIDQLFDPLLKAYDQGILCGNNGVGAYAFFFWLNLRFMAGIPLWFLEDDTRLLLKQVKGWKLRIHTHLTKFLLQVVLNLMGHNAVNTTELVGEVMSREDYKEYILLPKIAAIMRHWEGVLLTYFGDHVRQATATIRFGHDYLQKMCPSFACIALDTFLKGISCYAAAKETGKVKFLKMGELLRTKIKKWCKRGNPNLKHYESFLDAEFAALKNKKWDAICFYELTISQAGQTGFLQDAAFACERLGEFYLTVTRDQVSAADAMSESLEYWRQWGAVAKVKALEKKYGHLFPVLSTVLIKTPTKTLNCNDDVNLVD